MEEETVSIITGQKRTGKTSLLLELIRRARLPVLLDAWGTCAVLPERDRIAPPCQVNVLSHKELLPELLNHPGLDVFVDELDFYQEDDFSWYYLSKIIYFHRNFNLNLCCTMKYGRDILPVFRDQVDFWYIGLHSDPQIKEFYLGMGVSEELLTGIGRYGFLRYSPTAVLPSALLVSKPQ